MQQITNSINALVDLLSNNKAFIVCSYGCELAVGFAGADLSPYNWAYNMGATSGELHEMSEKFHYFLASEETLCAAMQNAVLTEVNKGDRGLIGKLPSMPDGVMPLVKQAVDGWFLSLPRENFMGQTQLIAQNFYGVSSERSESEE